MTHYIFHSNRSLCVDNFLLLICIRTANTLLTTFTSSLTTQFHIGLQGNIYSIAIHSIAELIQCFCITTDIL